MTVRRYGQHGNMGSWEALRGTHRAWAVRQGLAGQRMQENAAQAATEAGTGTDCLV